MFRILVVDDDKNTRMYFGALLASNGYTVREAKNGHEALDVMDREHVDLVVLAMMMMAMELEDAFNFKFTEFVKFETVGDVCRYLECRI